MVALEVRVDKILGKEVEKANDRLTKERLEIEAKELSNRPNARKLLDMYTMLRPRPDEMIIQRFDFERIDLNEITDLHNRLKEQFPNHDVITLPIDVNIACYTKDEARDLLNNIIEMVKYNFKEI